MDQLNLPQSSKMVMYHLYSYINLSLKFYFFTSNSKKFTIEWACLGRSTVVTFPILVYFTSLLYSPSPILKILFVVLDKKNIHY